MSSESSAPRRKLSAILMVDVSGFSRLMGRDEEGTTRRIREFQQRTQQLVESHEGRVVDTAGDSVFGEFDSVVNAVRCAQAIQDAQASANAGRGEGEPIETRIGVHLGDVIVQDYHVYGDGVNIAARLQAAASPGEICVSEAVYQQVYRKLDIGFEDLGVRELKNIEHPIRLYRVVLPKSARAAAAPPELPAAARTAGEQTAAGQTRPGATWIDALLHPSSLVPLLIGAYLLAAPAGLPAAGRFSPTAGAILLGIGVGRLLRLRTGKRGFSLLGLGVGLLVAQGSADFRLASGGLAIAGVILIVIGLTRLRSGARPRQR